VKNLLPPVTFLPFLTYEVLRQIRLVKVCKKGGVKFSVLMCWCIGRAAKDIKDIKDIKEYCLLPKIRRVSFGGFPENDYLCG